MKSIDRKLILNNIKSYVLITLGIAIYCFAVTAFLVPSGIISGGFGGIGTIVYFLTSKSGNGIPVGVTYFILNLIVFIFALKIMGWKFIKLSIYGVVVTSVLLTLFQKLITEPMIDDRFMCAVLGGTLGGFGLGLCFNNGGNTGGTDIISLIISKYRNVSTGRVSLYCNVIIVAAMYIIYRNPTDVVYAFVTMLLTSALIDHTLNGHRQSYQFIVMSEKYQEIADAFVNEIHKGVTTLDGKGWYSKQSINVLLVIVPRIDKARALQLIKRVDPNAFLSVSRVEGVFGKNFDTIK